MNVPYVIKITVIAVIQVGVAPSLLALSFFILSMRQEVKLKDGRFPSGAFKGADAEGVADCRVHALLVTLEQAHMLPISCTYWQSWRGRARGGGGGGNKQPKENSICGKTQTN